MSELDKYTEVVRSGKTQVLTDFYDWLHDAGYWICELDSDREEFYLNSKSPEQLFAEFFGIDLDKVEEERRELLERLRNE